MSECNHDCSSCGESCAERKGGSPFQIKPLREGCRVGKVYAVVSGKGGVGKSMVTSQLAVAVRREGYRVAVLDADITGPSIPKAFGVHTQALSTEDALLPVETATGIQLMSQGTTDQLYLSVRLAICDMVLPRDKAVPLIMDDALVTFDEDRLHAALDYLLQESRDRQILLFTCQRREQDYLAGRENVNIVTL